MINLFTKWHLIFLFSTITAVLLIVLIFALAFKKKRRVIFWTIMVMFILGVCTHFFRLFFPPPGSAYPWNLRYISLMSICAVHVILFPFLFLSKNKYVRDYIFYGGLFSGLMAMIFTPQDVLDFPLNGLGLLEVIRYFVTHGLLIAPSLLMVASGYHKLNWRRTWAPGFFMVAVVFIILLNDILLVALGIHQNDWASFFDNTTQNTGMVFGPINPDDFYSRVMLWLVPDFLQKAPLDTVWGLSKGDTFYWPVLWAAIPSIIYVGLGAFLVSLLFDAKRFGRDFKVFWLTITFQRKKRREYIKRKPKKLSTIKL